MEDPVVVIWWRDKPRKVPGRTRVEEFVLVVEFRELRPEK